MAVKNSAATASSSLGTGMYSAAYNNTNYHTDFLKTKAEQSIESTFIARNNININSNKDYNQTGSILKSNNGDIIIAAKKANIISSENTFQSEFGAKTTTNNVSVGSNGVGISSGFNQSNNFILQNTHTNSEILAKKGTFNLNTTNDTNIKGGNITANKVALNIQGDLNLETLQDTYEQQGSSFGLGVGAGANQSASLNNISISLGATEIFKKTTGKRTGIVALASNDNNLSEAENLTNLLASTSVNVAGNINNQTVKKDIDFTNADFKGTLSIPTDLITESGRVRVKDAINNLPENIGKTLNVTIGAAYRAGSTALDYKGFAENAEKKYIDGKLNRYHNKYSHQQSNIHYQETVGNGLISGVARAASEFLYQFPIYTVEDIGKRIQTNNKRGGRYRPYLWNSKGGIKDSFEDIGISSGIVNRRQEYNYNKVMFEQQFNKWKNEQKNN